MSLDHLSNAPLEDPDTAKAVDTFLESLDDLLDDTRYSFAFDTIEGIRKTVTETRVVTVGQRRAITNISISVQEKDDKKVWGRRYEGYSK